MTGETKFKPSLKDSEIRYHRLFEAAQDGILILDAGTGAITDVNPFLINMLGYAREEFVEKNFGKSARLRILKPAGMPSKHFSRMNIFAMKTCRCGRKPGMGIIMLD